MMQLLVASHRALPRAGAAVQSPRLTQLSFAQELTVNRRADAQSTPEPTGYRIDDLTLDIGLQRLTRGDEVIPLPALSFDLLLALAREAPNVLTYERLMELVWPGVVVNPETVTQRVKLVRDAIGDDPQQPRYIARVRSRGYRLLPPAIPVRLSGSIPLAVVEDSAVVPVPAAKAAVTVTKHRRRWVLVGGAMAVMALLVAAWHILGKTPERDRPDVVAMQTRTSVAVAPARTIAVLPFANLNGDPNDEYFSDGLTEELLNRLAALPQLHVVARTSSFHFKGRNQDVREIGVALGVRHVLEGSVRKENDRIRVSAQLVSTEDGYQLWSRVFDRPLVDVFKVQDEIALAVVENLELTLVQGARAQLVQHATNDPQVLDLYLRARHLYQSMQLDRIDKAVEYFEQAIELDPGFAAAYVSLADALFFREQIDGYAPDGGVQQARREELLRTAIGLDPRNADAHALLGQGYALYRLKPDDARRELHLAEEINPNGELVLRYLAQYYGTAGWPPERAIDYAQKGLRLDPLNPWAATNVAIAYWECHQYEAALEAADKAIELDPEFWVSHWVRDGALLDLGRPREALEAANRALELSGGYVDTYADVIAAYARLGDMRTAHKLFDEIDAPDRKPQWRPSFRAWALAGMGRYDEAVASLERAYREQDGYMIEMLHLKLMIPLHEHPRFRELVHVLKQEQRIEHARLMNEASVQRR
jgi:pentatricopeptide repeat protein